MMFCSTFGLLREMGTKVKVGGKTDWAKPKITAEALFLTLGLPLIRATRIYAGPPAAPLIFSTKVTLSKRQPMLITLARTSFSAVARSSSVMESP